MNSLRFLLLFLVGVYSTHALAEPWISNRYAQNCAGCHAPGRKNLPPKLRRCTLACQGCHVNPSGGGLRNHYGKWNEDRWLKSFRTDILENPKSTAPISKQKYADNKFKEAKKAVLKYGHVHVTTPQVNPDESQYDRRDGLEKITSKSKREFLYQIPQEDPYRLLLASKIDGGADLRYIAQRTTYPDKNKVGYRRPWSHFLMSVDFGLRWRPIYNRVHFVYEGRYFNAGRSLKVEDWMGNLSRRSMYVMVDELPYNLFVQGGYYRPQFGNIVPDHTALSQRIFATSVARTSRAHTLEFEAVTVGGSPNVPYANLHLIRRQMGPAKGQALEKTRGFALNLGGRFVTIGGSVAYTYWRTESDYDTGANGIVASPLEMHALTLGGQLWLSTINLEAMSFARDTPYVNFVQGGVYTVDTYHRIWREMYLNLQFAYSNVAEDLSPGKVSQYRLGVRAFLIAGVEGSMTYDIEDQAVYEVRNDADVVLRTGSTMKISSINWMLHSYL